MSMRGTGCRACLQLPAGPPRMAQTFTSSSSRLKSSSRNMRTLHQTWWEMRHPCCSRHSRHAPAHSRRPSRTRPLIRNRPNRKIFSPHAQRFPCRAAFDIHARDGAKKATNARTRGPTAGGAAHGDLPRVARWARRALGVHLARRRSGLSCQVSDASLIHKTPVLTG